MELREVTPVRRFIEALAGRDFAAMRAVLSASIAFRVLMPAGFREESSADAMLEYYEEWFAQRDDFKMLASDVYAVGDRIHGEYNIAATHEGQRYVLEQHFFAAAEAGRVTSLDLLCSGFRRVP